MYSQQHASVKLSVLLNVTTDKTLKIIVAF